MSKKRANGEGSVYKTKDGRVIGSWQDANDKTRYITSKTMTKREMSKAVRKKLQDRDEGIAAHSEGLTIERYMDCWLESGIESTDTALYREERDAVEPDLLVFDSWVGFLGACGLEENSNTGVEEWSNAYITPAKARDCAVVILDHVPHDANRSRGATRKKDFVDVQWSLKKVQDFSRSNVGYIQLRLHKDRESWLPKSVGFSIGGTPEGFVMERSEGTVSDLPGKLPESARVALEALERFGVAGATYTEWRDFIEWKGKPMPDSTFRKAKDKLEDVERIRQQGDRYYSTAQHFNSTAA
jgi:hypothetical protein